MQVYFLPAQDIYLGIPGTLTVCVAYPRKRCSIPHTPSDLFTVTQWLVKLSPSQPVGALENFGERQRFAVEFSFIS
jgi:hypothetical protein